MATVIIGVGVMERSGFIGVSLKRLVGAWGMLSDLCFADLLLFVPVAAGMQAALRFLRRRKR